MQLEKQNITVHDNELANGDPVVACIHDGNATSVTLGTGFASMSDCINHVTTAIETGEESRLISKETAAILEGASQVSLFTLAATIEK